MPKPLSIEEKLRRFSPIKTRLFARTCVTRKNRRPITRALLTAEIVAGSGLDAYEVSSLSAARSWDGVPVQTMLAFWRGCNSLVEDRKWLSETFRLERRFASRKGLPLYLKTSPEWHTVLLPLIQKW